MNIRWKIFKEIKNYEPILINYNIYYKGNVWFKILLNIRLPILSKAICLVF